MLAAIEKAAQVIRAAGTGEQTSKDLAAFEENLGALRDTLKQRRAALAPAP